MLRNEILAYIYHKLPAKKLVVKLKPEISMFRFKIQCNITRIDKTNLQMRQIKSNLQSLQMFKTLLLLGIINLAFTQVFPGQDSSEPRAQMADSFAKLILPPSKKCPDCFVTQICGPYRWTNWINRDLPSGTGDWETVSGAVGLGGCPSPIYLECQTTTGVSWWQTGEVVRFSTSGGCICVGTDNPPLNRCLNNYQIRELCPI